jgi:osmotically-inducible protein OsmY
VPARPTSAAEVAHRVRGVLDVVDHLGIRQPAVRLANGLHVDDAGLAEATRRALALVVGGQHSAVRSTVSHGLVALDGLVDADVRARAERAVAAVPGVEAVVNRLHLPVPDDGPDPAPLL